MQIDMLHRVAKLERAHPAVRLRRNSHPEDDIQKSIVEFVKISYPGAVIFSIPNMRGRTFTHYRRMVDGGMLEGIHDLCILWPRTGYWEPSFIEVKSLKGRVTDSQEALHERFSRLKIRHGVVHSLDEAVKLMSEWRLCS